MASRCTFCRCNHYGPGVRILTYDKRAAPDRRVGTRMGSPWPYLCASMQHNLLDYPFCESVLPAALPDALGA